MPTDEAVPDDETVHDEAVPDETVPDDETVVRTAADAAEDVIFSRFDRSEVRDFNVSIRFEDDVLEVDVYLDAPEGMEDPDSVVDDAALAARSAVDELFDPPR